MTKIASMTGIARGTVIGKRIGMQPTDEAEHVFNFEMCGDWFDMRDLGAVWSTRSPCPIRHVIKRSRICATWAGGIPDRFPAIAASRHGR
jgi:hypothetical protein